MKLRSALLASCALAAWSCSSPGTASDSGTATDSRAFTDGGLASDAGGDDATIDPGDDAGGNPVARDFTLRLRGANTYTGKALVVWVVDSTAQATIGRAGYDTIDGDEIEVRLPDLVLPGDYHVDVLVDTNGNGAADAGEPAWRADVPTDGSATVLLSTTAMQTDVRQPARTDRAGFHGTFTGFTSDETGHRFVLRVIDDGSQATVGAWVVTSVTSAVTVDLPGILDEGTSYRVDFFVDVDGSGEYSGPGQDHTWRVAPVAATASGATVSWTHTDGTQDLAWR